MDKVIQILIWFLIFVGSFASVIRQAGGVLMIDAEIKPLRDRFEGWWRSVSNLPPKRLTAEIMRKVDKVASAFCGQKLISYQSIKRGCSIGLSLLGCTLLLLTLAGIRTQLFIPWRNYHECMRILQSQPNSNLHSRQTKDKEDAQLTEKIADIAERLDSVPAAILFSVIFYSVLLITGAVGFSFSAIVFRKLLRSLSQTDDLFLVVSAFGFTSCVLVLLTTVCMLVIGIFGTPALWMFAPLAVIISAISWKLAFLVSVSAATLTWLFSGPSLLIVALIILSPLLIATIVTMCTVMALTNPVMFHRVIVRVLLLCKQKNPIVTLASLVALLALVLVLLLKAVLWIFAALPHLFPAQGH